MEFTATLSQVPFLGVKENLNAIVNNGFRNFANDVVKRAKENIHPSKSGLNNRTGNLRDSIKLASFRQFSPTSGATAVITAGNSQVPYASIHEYGGVIRPTKKPFLAFQIEGVWVRALQVNIPSRPYLRPALKELSPNFDSYLQASLNQILARLK